MFLSSYSIFFFLYTIFFLFQSFFKKTKKTKKTNINKKKNLKTKNQKGKDILIKLCLQTEFDFLL